jgi:hypothetical protein
LPTINVVKIMAEIEKIKELQDQENELHLWLNDRLTVEQKSKVMDLVEVNIALEELCNQ